MSQNETYAVVLTNSQKPPLALLGRVLSEFYGVPLQDGVQMAKPRWGLLAEGITQVEASRLQEICQRAQLAALEIPGAQVALNQTPRWAEAVRFAEQGLELAAEKDQWKLLPWQAISFMGAATFKTKVSRVLKSQEGPSMGEKLVKTGLLLATGLPLSMKKKKTVQTIVEEPELQMILDLFPRNSGLRIRLDALSLNYTFLGNRMQVGAQVNFRTFLKEFVRRAPDAMTNEGARSFISEPPVPLKIYETEPDFNTECRWLLTLSSLKSST